MSSSFPSVHCPVLLCCVVQAVSFVSHLFWITCVTLISGVMHSLFLRGHELWGGRHVTHSSHKSTYVLFIFSFLFETFPNTLRGGGGTMLFHAFRVVYTVKELDSHAKHGQSLKIFLGRITEYFCAKNLTSGFVQVLESFFRSLFLMT